MASRTVEDYVKQIYLEQLDAPGGGLVSMGKLASAMGVVLALAMARRRR